MECHGTLCGAAATWCFILVISDSTSTGPQPCGVRTSWHADLQGAAAMLCQHFSLLRHALWVDALDSLPDTSCAMSIMYINTVIYAYEAPSNQFQYLKLSKNIVNMPPVLYVTYITCIILRTSNYSCSYTTVQDRPLPGQDTFLTNEFLYFVTVTHCCSFCGGYNFQKLFAQVLADNRKGSVQITTVMPFQSLYSASWRLCGCLKCQTCSNLSYKIFAYGCRAWLTSPPSICLCLKTHNWHERQTSSGLTHKQSPTYTAKTFILLPISCCKDWM